MGVYTYTALLLSLTTLTFSFPLSPVLRRKKKRILATKKNRMDFMFIFIIPPGWYHFPNRLGRIRARYKRISAARKMDKGEAGTNRLFSLHTAQI